MAPSTFEQQGRNVCSWEGEYCLHTRMSRGCFVPGNMFDIEEIKVLKVAMR